MTCFTICSDASSDRLCILFTALYFATLSLTLPENVGRLLHGLFVIVLTVKVVQTLQGIAAYGIRKWAERTATEDPTSAAMLKNMTLVIRFMLWASALLFIFDNLGVNITAFVASLGIGGVAIALAAQAVLGTRSVPSLSSRTSRSRLGTSSSWTICSAP